MELSQGSIIELDKLAGEPVDILVNNKLIAKGKLSSLMRTLVFVLPISLANGIEFKNYNKHHLGGILTMANRILIVDDAAFMRMMIRDILTKNGYEVVGEAQDGAQAIEKYQGT